MKKYLVYKRMNFELDPEFGLEDDENIWGVYIKMPDDFSVNTEVIPVKTCSTREEARQELRKAYDIEFAVFKLRGCNEGFEFVEADGNEAAVYCEPINYYDDDIYDEESVWLFSFGIIEIEV